MAELAELTQESMASHLEARFRRGEIYTAVGAILVAVNPFRQVPGLYTPETLERCQRNTSKEPHVFAQARRAFAGMVEQQRDQSLIISGESGAGKTETTKLLLQFLTEVSGEADSDVQEQILLANPLMESFGNAQTVRNNNSSRFGKWIEVQFGSQRIVGATITSYLLEKSRIVKHSAGERNYHIFYQLCAAAKQDPKRHVTLRLGDPSEFRILRGNDGKAISKPNEDKGFETVMHALDVMQIAAEERECCVELLAAVLHLGNLTFDEHENGSGEGQASVRNDVVLAVCASLLGVGRGDLERCLISRAVGVRSLVLKPYTRAEAENARDALAKAIYARLFDWLIERINVSMERCGSSQSDTFAGVRQSIGVIDIFGFEIFELNSFEQLCINFCNEKLQLHFNQHIFELEQAEYAKEGVHLGSEINFVDNEPCVQMIEASRTGLFAMIDEEVSIPKGSDQGLLNKILRHDSKHLNQASFKAKHASESFVITHYAGDVIYSVAGFLEKNKDLLHADLQWCMRKSSKSLLSELFVEEESPGGGFSGLGLRSTGSTSSKGSAGSRAGSSRSRRKTLGSKFKEQLNNLICTLEDTEPHFIRCIKPNAEKVPDKFDRALVLQQLECAGMLEVCKIRQLGLPIRVPHDTFLKQYACVVSTTSLQSRDTDEATAVSALCEEFCEHNDLAAQSWQCGKTKVFLRPSLQTSLQRARDECVLHQVLVVQAFARMSVNKLRLVRFQSLLESLEAASSLEQVSEALQLCIAELPFQGTHLVQLQHAETKLATLREEARIEKLLADAVGSLDLDLLHVAINAAESFGTECEALHRAKTAVKEINAGHQAREDMRLAMASRDLDAVEASIEQAREHGLLASHDDILHQAVSLQSRLREEMAVKKQLTRALKKGQDAQTFATVLDAHARLGLASSTEVETAQRVAEALISVERAIKFKDLELLQEILQSNVLPRRNMPPAAVQELENLERQAVLQEAMASMDVEAIERSLMELGDLPTDLEHQACKALQAARVLEELEQQVREEDFEALPETLRAAEQLKLPRCAVLEAACSLLERGGQEREREIAKVSRLVALGDLNGLQELAETAQQQDAVQKGIDQVSCDAEFYSMLARCETIHQVEICCMNTRSSRASKTMACALEIENLLQTSKDVDGFVQAETLAAAAHLSGMIPGIQAVQARFVQSESVQKQLDAAVRANNVSMVRSLLTQVDPDSTLAQQCHRWLNRRVDTDTIQNDLAKALQEQDLDRLNQVLDQALKAGVEFDAAQTEKINETITTLEARRLECARVLAQSRALQSKAELPSRSITLQDLKPLQVELDAFDGDRSICEIQAAELVLARMITRIEAQARLEKALERPSLERLVEALDFASSNDCEHLDIALKVRRAIQSVRLSERNAGAAKTPPLPPPLLEKAQRTRSFSRMQATRELQLHNIEARRKRCKNPKFAMHNVPGVRSDASFAKGTMFLFRARAVRHKLSFHASVIPNSISCLGERHCELNRVAIRVNKCILGYCGDKVMAFPATMAQDILIRGLERRELVDEIYLQLFRHLSGNSRINSVARGWLLLCQVAGTLRPSKTLEPFVLNFFLMHKDQQGVLGLYASFALVRLENLLDSVAADGDPDAGACEVHVPSLEDIQAFELRPPVLLDVDLVDGSPLVRNLPVVPSLNVQEVNDVCVDLLGMTDPRAETFGLVLDGRLPLRSVDFVGEVFVDSFRVEERQVLPKFVFKRVVVLNGRSKDERPSKEDAVFNRLVFLQAREDLAHGAFVRDIVSSDHLVELVALAAAASGQAESHQLLGVELGPHDLGSRDALALRVHGYIRDRNLASRTQEELQDCFVDMVRKLDSFGSVSFVTDAEPLIVSGDGVRLGQRLIRYEQLFRWGGDATSFSMAICNDETKVVEWELKVGTKEGKQISGVLLGFINQRMEKKDDGISLQDEEAKAIV
ncbi:Myosin-I heavy chain (Class VII unconventional myosin) (DdMVII) (DdM7) [Durusdinium trenchii]|uniref:Myosin-I heavy chain (Class VII unconventional myosin) (DdMVII) (DdM7) n=1 Tax=Durusdinium trenchii TaxID=1381693 RepID=A0ABP0S2H8_9DINO